MRVRILVIGALLALVHASAPAADKSLTPELIREKLLRFGLEQSAALELLEDEDDWDIAYHVSTPSTYDLACRYKEELYYQVRFYLGRCYYIEKQLEIEAEDVDGLFKHFGEKLGETHEATRSRDGRLVFSRWSTEDREVTLTAYRRESKAYMITYEEFEPELIGLARHIQEKELENIPVETDPVTGKQRPKSDSGG